MSFAERKLDTTWRHAQYAFVKMMVMVMIVIVLCTNYSRVVATIFPTRVSSGNGTSWIVLSTRLYEYWVGPGDDDGDGCPYRIPYFLFLCVLDMMFLGW